MYKALYRKYRPKDFNEVYGQEVVKKTIINEINNDKISHAYLFCGPRGTGKTSVAKLVAKLINCNNSKNGVACSECESCKQIDSNSNLDIVEIDAASNNGVDEIRELKDKIKFLPTISKYKVYIIDEVHMLSIGAFNALLKTLEEPPKHVIFILATTEVHKIPITIISRCQRFDFKKISEEQIYSRLKYISTKENINITDEALKEISKLTDGGLRDAIGLLDKLISYTDEEINIETVHTVNYTVTQDDISKIISYLNENKIKEYINKINELDEQGKDLIKLIDEIIIYLRDILLGIKQNTISINNNKIIEYINFFNDLSIKIKNSNYPKILIETSIFILNPNTKEIIKENIQTKSIETQKETIKSNNKPLSTTKENNITDNDKQSIEEEIIQKKPEKKEENVEIKQSIKRKKIETIEELKNIRINNAFATANKECLNKIKSEWKKIHEYSIDNVYGIAAGMLIDGEVVLASNKNIIVTFPYESMAQRANDIIPLIEDVLNKCFESNYKFFAISTQEWTKLKNGYIKKLKNGEKYEYIEEDVDINKITNTDNEIIKESVEIFGSDLLQII